VKKAPPARKSVARTKPAPKPADSPKTVVKKKTAASTESKLKSVDAELMKLLNRRMELSLEALSDPVSRHHLWFNPQADQELWERLEAANGGPMTSTAMRAVFREMLSAARSRIRTIRVAYLGPSYSFTHLAAIERFGESATYIPVSSIAAVFEEVNRGHADFGIAPIENSTDGRVVDTLDMFTRLPLKICGEVQLNIHHNLLARCPRSEIVEIYSKPQALSQCREWLARNMPQSRLIEVTSTSTAAQLARDKPGAAAVASRQAATQYDLQIVADCIEDHKNNVTRFAIIGDEATRSSGKDKTALLLQVSHKPGVLADTLLVFKKNNVNLTWIESFPLRAPEVGYVFFIDFEGHVGEARAKRTIAELERKAVRLEILGSYPRSEPID
jgi:chorismate mutase/prephenate dehydratase